MISVRLWDIDQQKNVVIYNGHSYPVWDVDARQGIIYLHYKNTVSDFVYLFVNMQSFASIFLWSLLFLSAEAFVS